MGPLHGNSPNREDRELPESKNSDDLLREISPGVKILREKWSQRKEESSGRGNRGF